MEMSLPLVAASQQVFDFAGCPVEGKFVPCVLLSMGLVFAPMRRIPLAYQNNRDASMHERLHTISSMRYTLPHVVFHRRFFLP
jgi:hypothetical protein